MENWPLSLSNILTIASLRTSCCTLGSIYDFHWENFHCGAISRLINLQKKPELIKCTAQSKMSPKANYQSILSFRNVFSCWLLYGKSKNDQIKSRNTSMSLTNWMKQLLQVTEALKILVNPNDTCLMSKLILVCNCMYVLRFLSPMRKHWEKLKFWGKDKKFWSFDKNFHPSLSQIKGWHRGQAFLMTLLRNQNSPTCNLWHFFWIIKSSRIQD